MELSVVDARNVTAIAADAGALNMEVKFSHLADYVPFTASNTDLEHGKELYDRAIKGEFGTITVVEPQSEEWQNNVAWTDAPQ